MATRQDEPANGCKAGKEELLNKKKNPLDIDDDCPICRDDYSVLCRVANHPSRPLLPSPGFPTRTNNISPLPSFNEKSPSQIEECDVKKQRDSHFYSPCSSLFLLNCFISIYRFNPLTNDLNQIELLNSLVKICLTNMQKCLLGKDAFGYCSMKTMVEDGITALFTANFTTLFINYQLSRYNEFDNNIIIMHQSFNQGERKNGFNDVAIYYQFHTEDQYCFHGQRGLFPLIFMEFTKSTTKTIDKKLPQASLYANYFFRQQQHRYGINNYTNYIPLLGITFSESSYIIILYSFSVHNNQEKISEMILYSSDVMNESFLYLIIPLFDNYIKFCCKILSESLQHYSKTLLNPFNPIPNQTIIEMDNIMYKSYDYRLLSYEKHRIPLIDRRDYQGYKYSNLKYEIIVSYQNLDDYLDSLVIIKYEKIPGSHIPQYILHIIDALIELLHLHLQNIVFGDIRLSNIIFLPINDEKQLVEFDQKNNKSAYLIDFDLAGVEYERIYPTSFNVLIGDALRHPDALPEHSLQKIHDLYSFASICERFDVDVENNHEVKNYWNEAIGLIREGFVENAIKLLRPVQNIALKEKSIKFLNIRDTGSSNKR